MPADQQLRLSHRPVREEDLPLVCSFPQSAEELFYMFPKASYPLTREALSAAIDQRSDSTVVLADGQPAAFANFYQHERGGACTIGNVVVAPQWRGRGVGRYLIETMLDLAFTKHKAADVLVSCFSANAGALLFYSRLGFRPFLIEERTDYQGRQAALIHMRLVHGVKPA